MIIAVTGTPGTGKTEVAKLLAKLLSYQYIDLNSFAANAGLSVGTDKARQSIIVDTDKLEKIEFRNNTILDGHFSHHCKADVCIVLRTDPIVLRHRLEKRDWKKKKIDENVEAELLGVCTVEARELHTNVLDVDTSKFTAEKTAKLIHNWLARGKLRNDPIDWTLEGYEP